MGERGFQDDERTIYRERPGIEQTINRLKRFRRAATRYESLDASYLAMLTIATILDWAKLCRQALVGHERSQLGAGPGQFDDGRNPYTRS